MKVRSSLTVKQKNGQFVGPFTPYGYMKSPEDKNQLIVDENVSEYVQMIFSMYKDGFSIGRIADRLNQMGVLSPMEYKKSQGSRYETVFKTGETAKWTYKAVQRILTNEVYIGVLAQGKRGTPNYKVRAIQEKDESEWVKVENAHEPLISYDDFMAVKEMMKRDMRSSPEQDEMHLFSGFVFCADCGQSMSRKTVPSKNKKYVYYVCTTNKHTHACSPHSISEKELEEKVFRAIHDQIELVINLENALQLIEHLPSENRKVFNYGYQLHPTIPNKLAIDPESAAVVRHIFDLALSGCNTSVIAEKLNDEGVPTAGQYFRSKHPDTKKYNRMSDKVSWTATMVIKILQNYVYTGATVGHRRKKAGVGTKKTIAQDQSDWIVVEGMHEAIVSKDEFDTAQAVIRGGKKGGQRVAGHHPIQGLVRCGNCGRSMCRRKFAGGKAFYSCHHSIHDKNTECAVDDRYDEAELERVVYNAIDQLVSLAEQKAVEDHSVSILRQDAIKECVSKLKGLQKQADQYKSVKLRWYEKYSSGDISKEEYLKHKSEADAKLTEITEAIQKCEDRLRSLEADRPCIDEHLDAVCREFSQTETLTYELAHAFIKAIYVFPDQRVEIAWKFKDLL